jgi:PleD family two-component response regulator
MIKQENNALDEFDSRFKIFHELMTQKVKEILLVSRPYDAWIMEDDFRLSERITHEYRGLNLSHPPRLTWVSTDEEVLSSVEQNKFDMVIIMSRPTDMATFDLGDKIKQKAAGLPVILLSHSTLLSIKQFFFCKMVGSSSFYTKRLLLLYSNSLRSFFFGFLRHEQVTDKILLGSHS